MASTDDTPTRAQARYLRNAVAVMDAGTGKGNVFDLEGPLDLDAGSGCIAAHWVQFRGHDAGGYEVTAAGRAALARAEEQGVI